MDSIMNRKISKLLFYLLKYLCRQKESLTESSCQKWNPTNNVQGVCTSEGHAKLDYFVDIRSGDFFVSVVVRW